MNSQPAFAFDYILQRRISVELDTPKKVEKIIVGAARSNRTYCDGCRYLSQSKLHDLAQGRQGERLPAVQGLPPTAAK